jgi:hypothetical protein
MENQTTQKGSTCQFKYPWKRNGFCLILVALSFFFCATRSEAAYQDVVGGVKVSYSGDAVAYYDSTDGTLTVVVLSSHGSLTISVGPDAHLDWGNYVDIYIMADNRTLKSISIKGQPACTAYVCGEVWYVSKFALSHGVVGNTLYYGTGFGLGMGSNYIPSSISLRNSYMTAQLFGYSNR